MKSNLLKIPSKERNSETVASGSLHPFDIPSLGCFIMKRAIEYERGQKLGECIYLYEMPKESHRMAMFKCRCGTTFTTSINNVKTGHTTSCGCMSSRGRIGLENNMYKHGLRFHPLFNRWSDIKKRCYNKNFKYYDYYGGRGIALCDEWRDDFKSFYDYMMDLPNAMKDGYTLDRYPDNDGDYKPGNMRWATAKQQANNRRKRRWHKRPQLEKRYSY